MKTKILLVFALFLMLTGFYGEDRIVEQSGVYLQASVDEGMAPSFTGRPKIQPSEDGRWLYIELRIISDPKPSITWFRNGVVLKESQKYKMSLKTDGDRAYIAVLEINNITSADAGQYRINVKNEFGEANATANVSFDNE